MTVHNVYAKEAEKLAAAAKSELFENHYVKEGQVQKTWGEWMARSDISSIQKRYEVSKPNPKTDEGYGWTTPFNWVGSLFSSVLGIMGRIFKSIFGICFDYKEKKDEPKSPLPHQNRPSEIELFEGHYVIDGKIIPTWRDWFFCTDIEHVQWKFDRTYRIDM